MHMADFETLKEMIINGDEKATAQTEKMLAAGAGARDILDQALLPGMEIVGQRMKSGEFFIPEVLLSAETMQACLDLVKPHMAAGGGATNGTGGLRPGEGEMPA